MRLLFLRELNQNTAEEWNRSLHACCFALKPRSFWSLCRHVGDDASSALGFDRSLQAGSQSPSTVSYFTSSYKGSALSLPPSELSLSGPSAFVRADVVAVTLTGLVHPCAANLTVALSRNGTTVLLHRGSGTVCTALAGDYTFTDGGSGGLTLTNLATAYAPNTALASSVASTQLWPAAGSSLRSVFSGTEAGSLGPWSLIVSDNRTPTNGNIASSSSRICGWTVLQGNSSAPSISSIVGMRSAWVAPGGWIPYRYGTGSVMSSGQGGVWPLTIPVTTASALVTGTAALESLPPLCDVKAIVLHNAFHPALADLIIRLRHTRPTSGSATSTGTVDSVEVTLAAGPGSVPAASNISLAGWYLLSASGSSTCVSCAYNNALPSGTYAPLGNATVLSAFTGRGSSGTWELLVQDVGSTATNTQMATGMPRGSIGCFQLQFGTQVYFWFACPSLGAPTSTPTATSSAAAAATRSASATASSSYSALATISAASSASATASAVSTSTSSGTSVGTATATRAALPTASSSASGSAAPTSTSTATPSSATPVWGASSTPSATSAAEATVEGHKPTSSAHPSARPTTTAQPEQSVTPSPAAANSTDADVVPEQLVTLIDAAASALDAIAEQLRDHGMPWKTGNQTEDRDTVAASAAVGALAKAVGALLNATSFATLATNDTLVAMVVNSTRTAMDVLGSVVERMQSMGGVGLVDETMQALHLLSPVLLLQARLARTSSGVDGDTRLLSDSMTVLGLIANTSSLITRNGTTTLIQGSATAGADAVAAVMQAAVQLNSTRSAASGLIVSVDHTLNALTSALLSGTAGSGVPVSIVGRPFKEAGSRESSSIECATGTFVLSAVRANTGQKKAMLRSTTACGASALPEVSLPLNALHNQTSSVDVRLVHFTTPMMSGVPGWPVTGYKSVNGSNAADAMYVDARAGSGLDSPVISVTVQQKDGSGEIPIANLDHPVLITVPLSDPVQLQAWNDSLLARQPHVVNVTCPTEVEMSEIGLFMGKKTRSGYSVINIRTVRYWVPALDPAYAASATGDRGAENTAVQQGTWRDFLGQTMKIGALPGMPEQPENVSYIYTPSTEKLGWEIDVSVPCRRAGPQNAEDIATSTTVTCGPGFYGAIVRATCSVPQLQPMCGYWDAHLGEWSTSGCVAHEVRLEDGVIICACNHLTDFAARFAAVKADNAAVFSQADKLLKPNVAAWYPHVFIILGAQIGVVFFCCLWAVQADVIGNRRFREHLLKDEEVQFLASLAKAQGRPFVLDRVIDYPAARTRTCCCAGRTQDPSNSATTSGAKKLLRNTSRLGNMSVRAMMNKIGAGSRGTGEAAVSVDVVHADAHAVQHAPKRSNTRFATVAQLAAQYNQGSITRDKAAARLQHILASQPRSGGYLPVVPRDSSAEGDDGEADGTESGDMEAYERSSASCLTRYAAQGYFVVQLWALRLWMNHTYISAMTRFDPGVSRFNRMAVLVALLAVNMCLTATFFAFREDGSELGFDMGNAAGASLSEPSPAEIFVMALVVAAVQEPIAAVLMALMAWAGEAEFKWRRPSLWRELARRRVAQEVYSAMPASDLGQELERLRQGLHGHASSIGRQGIGIAQLIGLDTDAHTSIRAASRRFPGKALCTPPVPATSSSTTRTVHVASRGSTTSAYLLQAEEAGLLANGTAVKATVADATAVADMLDKCDQAEPAQQRHDGSEEQEWVDPPPACVTHCAPLVTACGRHPSQRSRPMQKQPPSGKQSSGKVTPSSATSGVHSQAVSSEAERAEDLAGTLGDVFQGVRGGNAGSLLSTIAASFVVICGRKATGALCGRSVRSTATARHQKVMEGSIAKLDAQLLREQEHGRPCFHNTGGCTPASLIAYSLVTLVVAYCFLYVLLFGMYQPQRTTQAFLLAWLTSQVLSALVLQPAILLAILAFAHSIWPVLVRYTAWMPVCSPCCGSATGAASAASRPDVALTARLENLTILKAAGYASMLQPESALLAFAATSTIAMAADSLHRSRSPSMSRPQERPQHTFAGLSTGAKRALIVDLYLLDELRAAARHQEKQASSALVLSHATEHMGSLCAADAGAASAAAEVESAAHPVLGAGMQGIALPVASTTARGRWAVVARDVTRK